MKFTIIKSIYSNEVTDESRYDMSWEKFCKILSKPLIVDNKSDVVLITPAEYYTEDCAIDFTETGKVRRCSENIKSWWAVPVDVDGQMTIDAAKERFAEYEYVLYTTFSHQSVEKPYDCFRMFFLLEEPVSNTEFTKRIRSIKDFIGSHDNSTLAISRSFYIPSCSEAGRAHAMFYHNTGKHLDLLEFEPEIEEIYIQDTSREAPSIEFKEKVLAELYKLREIEYDLWWKIGSAMQESGYSEGEFAALSSVIRSHRKNKCRSQWRCSKRKKIGFGYLVNLCIEHFGREWLKGSRPPSTMEELGNKLFTLSKQRLTNLKNHV